MFIFYLKIQVLLLLESFTCQSYYSVITSMMNFLNAHALGNSFLADATYYVQLCVDSICIPQVRLTYKILLRIIIPLSIF